MAVGFPSNNEADYDQDWIFALTSRFMKGVLRQTTASIALFTDLPLMSDVR
jgi:hypothetical protein